MADDLPDMGLPDAEEPTEKPAEPTGKDKGKRLEDEDGAAGNQETPPKKKPKKKATPRKPVKKGVLAEAMAATMAPKDSDSEEENLDDYANFDFFNQPGEELHRQRLNEVIQSFTPAEEKRFQCYFRSKLPKNNVGRYMSSVIGTPVNPTIPVIMAGITKIFVGELVEAARIVQAEWKEGTHNDAIQPRHYREAYRRLRNAGKIPCTGRETMQFARP